MIKQLSKILLVLTILCLFIACYSIGKTVGESKALSFAYRLDHLEKRVSEFCVIENGKNSGFSRSMHSDNNNN